MFGFFKRDPVITFHDMEPYWRKGIELWDRDEQDMKRVTETMSVFTYKRLFQDKWSPLLDGTLQERPTIQMEVGGKRCLIRTYHTPYVLPNGEWVQSETFQIYTVEGVEGYRWLHYLEYCLTDVNSINTPNITGQFLSPIPPQLSDMRGEFDEYVELFGDLPLGEDLAPSEYKDFSPFYYSRAGVVLFLYFTKQRLRKVPRDTTCQRCFALSNYADVLKPSDLPECVFDALWGRDYESPVADVQDNDVSLLEAAKYIIENAEHMSLPKLAIQNRFLISASKSSEIMRQLNELKIIDYDIVKKEHHIVPDVATAEQLIRRASLKRNTNEMLIMKIVSTCWDKMPIGITSVQRTFSLGFARSAGIVEKMVKLGIISPLREDKTRELLVDQETAERILKDSFGDAYVPPEERE